MNTLDTPVLTADRVVSVAIDPENDFLTGSLVVPDGEAVIPRLNDVNEWTRKIGGQVIVTRDWHPEQTPHFDKWPVHCVAGTKGAEFHPDLDVHEEDVIISKGMGQTDGYSATEGVSESGQTIESIIVPRTPRERVIVLMGGVATDYCVLETVLKTSAMAEHYNSIGHGHINVVLIRDAIRAVNIQPDDGDKAVKLMLDAKAIALSSQEIINGAIKVTAEV